MLGIEMTAVKMAAQTLENANCHFKIICPNGETFGDLEVAAPKPPRTRIIREDRVYGEVKQHTMQYIDLDAPMGKLLTIPRGKYDHEEVRGSVCSTLTQAWGRKTYKTEIVGDNIHAIRLPVGAQQ